MNIRIQVIVAIVLVLALCVIINMIRKKALELRYALAWLLVGCGTLILDLFPDVMMGLAKFMGIEVPSNMLFFLGFCFALIIIFVLTIAVSRMSIRIKNLTQEMALYKKYIQEKENNNKNDESR